MTSRMWKLDKDLVHVFDDKEFKVYMRAVLSGASYTINGTKKDRRAFIEAAPNFDPNAVDDDVDFLPSEAPPFSEKFACWCRSQQAPSRANRCPANDQTTRRPPTHDRCGRRGVHLLYDEAGFGRLAMLLWPWVGPHAL